MGKYSVQRALGDNSPLSVEMRSSQHQCQVLSRLVCEQTPTQAEGELGLSSLPSTVLALQPELPKRGLWWHLLRADTCFLHLALPPPVGRFSLCVRWLF